MKNNPNKLIKRVLNLKEDYKLDLNEGEEDSELEVISEGITKEAWEEICKKAEKPIYLNTITSLKERETIKYLNRLPGLSKKDLDLLSLKKFCEEKYGKDFIENETLKKDLIEIIMELFVKNFAEQWSKNKSTVPSTTRDHDRIIVKQVNKQDNVGGGQESKDLTEVYEGLYKSTHLNELLKRIMKDLENVQEDQPEKQEVTKKGRPSKEETTLKDIAKKLGISLDSSTPNIDQKDTSEFQKLSSAFETELQKQNALNITNKAIKLIDSAVDCFGVGSLPKNAVGVIQDAAKNQLGESLKESDATDNNSSGTAVPEVAEISSEEQKIKNFLKEKNYGAVKAELQSGTNANNLATALLILRLLILSPELFGEMGNILKECKELKADMQNTYIAYMTNLFKEYFHSAFYNPDNPNALKFNANDEAQAAKAIEDFADLINNTKNDFSLGPEFQNFISANGVGKGLHGTGATSALALAISGLLDTAVILKNKRLSVSNKEDLIRWRKKDCNAAHKAFDEQLKAKLKTCFDDMLKATFEVEGKNGKPTEALIKDYMFDVEIPRRFKKVLNQENESFEEFIKAYYDESIVGEKKGILKDYFEQVAEDKEKASMVYKEKDATQATHDVEEDEKVSIEKFKKVNDFTDADMDTGSEGAEEKKTDEEDTKNPVENPNPVKNNAETS